jgi:hypothetical protein
LINAPLPACHFQIFWEFSYSKGTGPSINVWSGENVSFYV